MRTWKGFMSWEREIPMSSCSITNKCLSALGRKNAFPGAGLFLL